MSNLFVYGVTYLLLRLNNDNSSNDSEDNITRADSSKFMYLTIIVTSVGVVFQIIFHLGTNEKNLRSDDEIHEEQNSNGTRLDWKGYLKSPKFYVVSRIVIIYFC